MLWWLVQAGQRAYVGLVCMDRNSAQYYTKPLQDNLRDTEAFIYFTRSGPYTQQMLCLYLGKRHTPSYEPPIAHTAHGGCTVYLWRSKHMLPASEEHVSAT